MDIILRDGVIEYRIVGGTLDLTFFSGPTPTAVVQQYGAITGFSQLPPLYGLGFNLCRCGLFPLPLDRRSLLTLCPVRRWGYQNVSQTREVVTSMKNANIPLEIMWNDIDYMDAFRK